MFFLDNFASSFKFAFRAPKTDTCQTCEKVEDYITAGMNQQQQDFHQRITEVLGMF